MVAMRGCPRAEVNHRPGTGRFRVTLTWPGDKEKKAESFDLSPNVRYAFVEKNGGFAFEKQ